MGCGASSASVAAVEDSVPSPQPLAATAAPDARGAEVRHDDEQARQAQTRVPLLAARTLNATGQSRVTLSLR